MVATLTALMGVTPATAAEMTNLPAGFGMAGHETILTVQGTGAQIYECKARPDGTLGWVFREPIATLTQAGRTVGRHFAGPSWEVADGTIAGKVVASAPGTTPGDIPQLELEVTSLHGAGPVADAHWVLRLHTRGGTLAGACERSGELNPVTYTADYVFLK